MARSRNIKPGFFINPDLAECSAHARLLFIGLWLLADRDGRLEDRPRHIKVQIFPCEHVDVDLLLGELHSRGFAIRYEHSGQRYIWIPGFTKHQNPHKNEVASIIPEFSAENSRVVETRERSIQNMSAPAESISLLLNPSPEPVSLTAARVSDRSPEVTMAFDEIFHAYPAHRRDKRKAFPIFSAGQLWKEKEVILALVERAKTSLEWKRDAGRYIPSLDLFFERRPWDAPEAEQVDVMKIDWFKD